MMAVGNVQNLNHLPNQFGCIIDELPGTYLGIPLGNCVKSKQIWDPVVQRVNQRLATWKGCYLSKGGRITLITALFLISKFITCPYFVPPHRF